MKTTANSDMKKNDITTEYLWVDIRSTINLIEKNMTTTCDMKQSDIANEHY